MRGSWATSHRQNCRRHRTGHSARQRRNHERNDMDGLKQRPLLWDMLTWEEIGSLRKSGLDLCLLPIGATEQHGPHLGVGMDTCNALKLCEAVSGETGVPMLPPLSYGCSLGHSRRWPGTLALQPQTLMVAVVEIFDWLQNAGF